MFALILENRELEAFILLMWIVWSLSGDFTFEPGITIKSLNSCTRIVSLSFFMCSLIYFECVLIQLGNKDGSFSPWDVQHMTSFPIFRYSLARRCSFTQNDTRKIPNIRKLPLDKHKMSAFGLCSSKRQLKDATDTKLSCDLLTVITITMNMKFKCVP